MKHPSSVKKRYSFGTTDKELQKKIHTKYKAFYAKYEDKQGKFESREDEIKKFAVHFKELDKNALKIYMSHRYPVDPANPMYKQKNAAAMNSVDAHISHGQ